MASKRRSPRSNRRSNPQKLPPRNRLEHQRLVNESKFAAQIIESMVDDLRAAVKCVEREMRGIFEVDYDLNYPKRGRIDIYLRAYTGKRKHAHFVVALGTPNELVSTTLYGRYWSS